MKVIAAEFLKSCATLAQCPHDGLSSVACVGRSNVGKSSLINTLLHRKGLAKVSRTPGKTRLLNFFQVSLSDPHIRRFYLVDLPGYGYAKVAKSMREEWGALINQYLEAEPSLRGILFLVDARVVQAQDETAYRWLTAFGHRPVIVLTKMDKLKQNERRVCAEQVRKRFQLFDEEAVIAYSSVTREGSDALWKAIATMLTESVSSR